MSHPHALLMNQGLRATFVPEAGVDFEPVLVAEGTFSEVHTKVRDFVDEDWRESGDDDSYYDMRAIQLDRLSRLETEGRWGMVIPMFYGSLVIT